MMRSLFFYARFKEMVARQDGGVEGKIGFVALIGFSERTERHASMPGYSSPG
jgi:hypothetical protein